MLCKNNLNALRSFQHFRIRTHSQFQYDPIYSSRTPPSQKDLVKFVRNKLPTKLIDNLIFITIREMNKKISTIIA